MEGRLVAVAWVANDEGEGVYAGSEGEEGKKREREREREMREREGNLKKNTQPYK